MQIHRQTHTPNPLTDRRQKARRIRTHVSMPAMSHQLYPSSGWLPTAAPPPPHPPNFPRRARPMPTWKASIAASLSHSRRSAADCTRPADRAPGSLRQSSGLQEGVGESFSLLWSTGGNRQAGRACQARTQ